MRRVTLPWVRALIICLLTQSAFEAAWAFDQQEHEGLITNNGSGVLYCYKDINTEKPGWTLCMLPITPGQSCRADGVAAGVGGPMFKVPNRASFNCSYEGPLQSPKCAGADRASTVMLELAKVKRPDGYGAMTWAHFQEIMTGGSKVPIKKCDKNWQPVPPSYVCHDLPEAFRSEYRHMDEGSKAASEVAKEEARTTGKARTKNSSK